MIKVVMKGADNNWWFIHGEKVRQELDEFGIERIEEHIISISYAKPAESLLVKVVDKESETMLKLMSELHD